MSLMLLYCLSHLMHTYLLVFFSEIKLITGTTRFFLSDFPTRDTKGLAVGGKRLPGIVIQSLNTGRMTLGLLDMEIINYNSPKQRGKVKYV